MKNESDKFGAYLDSDQIFCSPVFDQGEKSYLIGLF